MSGATPKTAPTKGMKISFNNTPQAVDDSLTLTEADGNYLLDVLANDLTGVAKQLWSLHDGEPLEPVIDGRPVCVELAEGTLTINADGTIDFVPSDDFYNEIQALGEGVLGASFSFWYVIRMANGAFAKAEATITFEGVNDVATITGDTELMVKEDRLVDQDGFLVAVGKLDVEDKDTGESVFQEVTDDVGLYGYGFFSIDADGNWTYRVANDLAAVQDLKTGESLTDSYTFLSKDGTEQIVTVTINGTDEPVTVALDYTPPTPDEIIPGTPGTSVNLTFTLPTIQGVVGGTGTLQDPIPSGQWNQWQTWQTNLAAWRQANDPTGLDTNTATTPITVYWRQGGNPTQTEPFSYDNTITYTTSGTPDVIIPGDPAELVLIGADAFLQWNADTDLTFTGATTGEIEALVSIAMLDIDGEGDIGDTLLTFTDGSTVTLIDAGFADFASFFASDQVSVIA